MINIKKILKKNTDFTTFTAVIMEPVTDAHDDLASPETIKKAAHDYLKKQKMKSKINHEKPTEDVSLVESYLLKNDTDFDGQIIKKGAWIGEFEVNNEEIKEDIANEDLTGVSIGGHALTSKIEKRAKRNLDVVFIDEISVVDEPANQRKILKLNKRKGDIEVDFEEIMKKLSEDKELFKKVKSEFKKKNEEEEEDEETKIKKSMGDSAYNKYKETQNQLKDIQKRYEEIEKKTFKDSLTSIKKHLKADNDSLDALYKISKEFPEEYKNIEKSLNFAVNTIENIHKMNPIGEDGNHGDDMSSDNDLGLIAINKSKDEKIPLSKAYEKAMKLKKKAGV